LCSVCVPDRGSGFTTSLVMVLLCSVCVPDLGPGFTTSLSGTQTEHNNAMTSDVVNPGPGSGTQTEHNNTMKSDVLNPGPESGTETEHNNTMTSDGVQFVCLTWDLDLQRHLSW
jgi:hypothetical protein